MEIGMTTYIVKFHVCCSEFIIEQKKMNVYYIKQLFKQCININLILTTYPNLETRNRIYCMII